MRVAYLFTSFSLHDDDDDDDNAVRELKYQLLSNSMCLEHFGAATQFKAVAMSRDSRSRK